MSDSGELTPAWSLTRYHAAGASTCSVADIAVLDYQVSDAAKNACQSTSCAVTNFARVLTECVTESSANNLTHKTSDLFGRNVSYASVKYWNSGSSCGGTSVPRVTHYKLNTCVPARTVADGSLSYLISFDQGSPFLWNRRFLDNLCKIENKTASFQMNLDSSDCIAQPSGIFYSATILQTFVFPEATRNSTAGTDSSSSSSSSQGSNNTAAIVGGVSAVLLVIVAAGVAYYFYKKRIQQKTISIPQPPQPQQPPQNHDNFFLTSSAKTTTTELPPPQQPPPIPTPLPPPHPPPVSINVDDFAAGKAVSVVPEPLPTKQNIFASMTNSIQSTNGTDGNASTATTATATAGTTTEPFQLAAERAVLMELKLGTDPKTWTPRETAKWLERNGAIGMVSSEESNGNRFEKLVEMVEDKEIDGAALLTTSSYEIIKLLAVSSFEGQTKLKNALETLKGMVSQDIQGTNQGVAAAAAAAASSGGTEYADSPPRYDEVRIVM